MQLENDVFLREMQELPYFHVQGHTFQKNTLHSTPCSWNSSLSTLQLSCFHPGRFSTVSSARWTNRCRKKIVVCMVVVCCHSYRASNQFEATMLPCFAPAFGCPERVTKQNSAPTWQSWCYEVHGTLKVPTSKPVLTVMTSDIRTRFHCCLDYTLEAHVWHPLII